MMRVCQRAAAEGLPIYLYGSRRQVLGPLVANLTKRFRGLEIAGAEPSRFGRTDEGGKRDLVRRIQASRARITFVGLGCPRQETFVYEFKDDLGMPTVAVGAAFDYHAGALTEPPAAIQRAGLQWAYPLAQDPRRLWRRYLVYKLPLRSSLASRASVCGARPPWAVGPSMRRCSSRRPHRKVGAKEGREFGR